MTKYEELEQKFQSIKVEAVKFYEKSNASAGVRLRKCMIEIKKMAHEVRAEIAAIKSEAKAEKETEK